MRGRTLLAGVTLTLLTLVWSAPAALAAPDDQDDPTQPSAGPARPGNSEGNQVRGNQNQGNQNQGDNEPPSSKPAPKPVQQPKPSAEPKPAEQIRPSTAPEIAIPEPKAALSVSPKTVKQGETVSVNPRCDNGQVRSISAPDTSFSGNSGRVSENASEGTKTVTLVCQNGPKQATATDSFQVVRKDGGAEDLKASLSVFPKTVRPGDTINANPRCGAGQVKSLSAPDVNFSGTTGRVNDRAGDGDRTVTLTCQNGPKQTTATDAFRITKDGVGIGDPKATLSVSPREVKQGEYIWANGYCLESSEQSLTGDDVRFRGNKGFVDDNAREGEHTVKRVCRSGNKTAEATDAFRVVKGDGWRGEGPADFWLSDRSGDRGDEIDASVRCRDNNARLESDALDDITLRRDGSRLTGTTHVEHDAKRGWHRVTVHCDGHSASLGFWVNRDWDGHDWLDLDPGYGHRGDAIDVNVRCGDGSVGRLQSENDVLDDIELDHDHDSRYQGTTHVRDDADYGEHEVRIRCGDHTLHDWFFVRGDGDRDNNDEPDGGEYVSVYPKGGVETGGGPVANQGLGVLALGLTGLTSAGMAGAGTTLARRGVRR